MSMIATLRRAWDGSLGVWFARLRLRARRGTHRLFIGAPPVDPLVPYRHIALQLNYGVSEPQPTGE